MYRIADKKDEAMAAGNMHKNLVKFDRVVF